jgi:pilus assembly protein Flp/PilA
LDTQYEDPDLQWRGRNRGNRTYQLRSASAKGLRRIAINNLLLKLYFKIQDLVDREEGQDMVEYALVVALIAFAATAGMKDLASGMKTAFNNMSTQLGSSIS